MAKTRVYQLAKELEMESAALLEKLQEMGIEAKTSMATLDDNEVERVKHKFLGTTLHTVKSTRVATGVIRRRVSTVPEPAAPKPAAAKPAAPKPAAPPPPAAAPKAEPAAKPKPAQEAPPAAEPVAAGVSAEAAPAPEEKAGEAAAAEYTLPDFTPPPEPSTAPHEIAGPLPASEATHFHVVPPSGSVEPTVYIPATEDDEEARRRRLMKKKTGTRPFDRREGLFGDRRGKAKRGGSKKASKTEITVPKAIKRKIRIEDTITVQDLAKGMSVKVGDLIRKLMGMGVMATANQALDVDTATILAGEFEYEVENVALAEETFIEKSADKAEDLRPRPPVVTVMGHVDHGKTLLLDAIRRTNVVSGEAGGITQHIGAYKVNAGGSEVVFLDTPGHEAFSAMRARGANVTDLVVLVVAANDGVMPQTVEAINHAKAAGAPIIVAVNKIDLPEANPDRVERGLMEHGLVPERLGGDTAVVHVSAKSGKNIESLLEMIHLQADVLELKANPDKPARGRVIEAKIEKGRGPVATVLVREGTLKVGDPFVCGVQYGRVRAMQDENGRRIESAGPSTPVEILGMPGVPEAGDEFSAVATEKDARTLGEHRALKAREAELRASSKVKLEDIFTQMQAGEKLNLGVIVKADVQGSVEAVAEALRKLSTDKVELKVIHAAAGGITESDVNLAASANAIIIGFHVRPEPKVAALAEREKVEVRLYQIIYDAVDDVKSAMEGMLAPTIKEVFLGRAQVRDTFSIPRIGVIAGSYVTDGKIERNSRVRLIRDSVQIYEGKLGSLRRFKDDVREVAQGYECGIGLENFNDVKVGDVIESFTTEEVKTEL